jgi:hypothetical protein
MGWTKPVATIEDLFSSNFLPTSSVVFRNHLFRTFPSWFRDLAIGDWALHILNAEHGDIGFMPDVMSVYRVHRGGLWSSATQAERLILVFELFSVVDHHFGGKYTQSINAYRADNIQWIMSQLDAATFRLSEATEQIGSAQAQRDEQTLASVQTQAQVKAQAEAYSQLLGRYAVLEQNTRSLQEFYETWTKSILYRVEREIRRPFRRLSRYLRNRVKSTDETTRHEPPISKAA